MIINGSVYSVEDKLCTETSLVPLQVKKTRAWEWMLSCDRRRQGETVLFPCEEEEASCVSMSCDIRSQEAMLM